jgi:histidyl-tRNA synthetase
MAKGTYIQPELAGGFRDYLPEDMIPRQKMLDTIKTVFERFGFVPLETSSVQLTKVLLSEGEEADKLTYRLNPATRGDSGDAKDELSLRFDLTVSLARFIAGNQEKIKLPFKRYEIGKVWRGERQQAGRSKEFIQADADIVGSSDVAADAEIIALIYKTMRALRFKDKDFIIKISNREILNQLPNAVGFDIEKLPQILRALDKLDKIGWGGVKIEMCNFGLKEAQVDEIREFVGKEDFANGDYRMLKLFLLPATGIPRCSYKFDFSVARGLGYYTGTVFETVLTKLPAIGSVISGGRYDSLVSRFGSRRVPAVGASVGVDRLFEAMEKLGMVKGEGKKAKVCVLNFEGGSDVQEQRMKVASELRAAKIPTDLFFVDMGSFNNQIGYAASQGYLVAVIVGDREFSEKVVQVKDLKNRLPIEVSGDKVVETVKGLL